MKILTSSLLVLILSGISVAQKMTDRLHAGLIGKVKTVTVQSQRIGPDAKPTEEARTDSETVFDEEGNMTHSTTFDMGEYRTSYFQYHGKHVSKSEVIGGEPAITMTIPNGFTPAHTLNKKPFDYEYKYHFDRHGRIVEISGHADHGTFVSHDTYGYDNSDRIVSETNVSAHGGSRVNISYKYDDHGNEIERLSESSIHSPNGVEKHKMTVRYHDYAFDEHGNWTARTATVHNDKEEVESVTLLTRHFVYY